MKSVVSFMCDLIPFTIGSRWISTNSEILDECELMEMTMGRPGLFILCTFGRKHKFGAFGLLCNRILPRCSLISFSFRECSDCFVNQLCMVFCRVMVELCIKFFIL